MAQLITIESGVLEVTSDRDYTVPLQGSFSSPPLVLLTGEGLRSHSTACLIAKAQHAITCTSFTARLIHQYSSSPGAWEKGRVHWVAISPSALGGVVPISTSGDRVISFNRPFGSHPAVIATGQGNSNHSTACLPNDSSVSTTSALLRLIDHLCAWETGMLHYFAADQPVLSSLVPGAKCGIVAITSNEDVRVELQGFTEPPVVLLCGAGNDGHSTACLLHDTVKADGFTARLITNQGCWNHGALHWMAFPAGPAAVSPPLEIPSSKLTIESGVLEVTSDRDYRLDLKDGDPDTHDKSLQRLVDDKDDFQPRSPFAGLFRGMTIVSLEESLAIVVPQVEQAGLFDSVAVRARKPALAKKYPDTDEILRKYLVAYTTELHPPEISPYWGCNGALREQDRSKMKPWVPFALGLTRALRSLPEADVTMAYRGYRKSPEELGEDFVEGGVIVFSSFVSIAEVLKPMQTFVGTTGNRTMLHLHLLKDFGGKRIKDFSFFPSEAELVLEPNSTFEIMSVVDLGAGLTMIECQQLPTADLIP